MEMQIYEYVNQEQLDIVLLQFTCRLNVCMPHKTGKLNWRGRDEGDIFFY